MVAIDHGRSRQAQLHRVGEQLRPPDRILDPNHAQDHPLPTKVAREVGGHATPRHPQALHDAVRADLRRLVDADEPVANPSENMPRLQVVVRVGWAQHRPG